MIISIIVSISENRVIGYKGRLPWNIPEDMEWFKNKTTGHFVVMGRKTYESIGKALENRKCIVLTRNENLNISDVILINSPSKAIEIARKYNEKELFIIGGEEIYREFIDLADRIYLTIIHKMYDGDRFFPDFNKKVYNLIFEKSLNTDPSLTFYIYERKSIKI